MGVINMPGARGPGSRSPVDSGGGPPHDASMEQRIQKLESLSEKVADRLTVLERDVAVIRANYATKEDLHKELHATTWKIITAIAALCAAVFWLARNIEPPRAPSTAPSTSTSAPQAPAATPLSPVK